MGDYEAGKKNRPGYLTIGEFAAACNVAKSTLRYYDQIGLFSPDTLDDNGYRYYSLPQMPELIAILTLQKKNMHLKDIKKYMDSRSPKSLIKLLDVLSNEITEKMFELMAEKQNLDTMRSIAEEGLLNERESFIISDMPEEYCIRTPYEKPHSTDNWYLTEMAHNRYVRSLEIKNAYLSGIMRYTYGDSIDDTHAFEFFQTRIREKSNLVDVFIKPAGKYLTLYFAGGYTKTPYYHKMLLQYAEEHDYALDEFLYEDIIFDELAEFEERNHMLRLSVRLL